MSLLLLRRGFLEVDHGDDLAIAQYARVSLERVCREMAIPACPPASRDTAATTPEKAARDWTQVPLHAR
ncbi:hypothetical protein D3C86_1952210 [compost metagenome]